MNLDAKALIGFIQEIEASRARQKGETEHQREVFKRAREKHFDAKAMRIVLQRRAMDASRRDEQDYNVECYEAALAGKRTALEAIESGATIRDAAKAGGISVGAAAALAKHVQESSFVNATPHDLETGEVTETAGVVPQPGDGAQDGGHTLAAQPAAVANDLTIPPFLRRERVVA